MSYEELADMEHDPTIKDFNKRMEEAEGGVEAMEILIDKYEYMIEELIGHVKYREGLEEQLIEREQQRADAWAERQMWKDLYLELQAYHEKEEN